jgi:hypothetical protein
MGKEKKSLMLKRLYEAECGIARSIRQLMKKTASNNDSLKIDLDHPEFKMFDNDADQVIGLMCCQINQQWTFPFSISRFLLKFVHNR